MDEIDKNYCIRHDLKVDPSFTFEGVKVKTLADGYNVSPVWKVDQRIMVGTEKATIEWCAPSDPTSWDAMEYEATPPEQSQQP